MIVISDFCFLRLLSQFIKFFWEENCSPFLVRSCPHTPSVLLLSPAGVCEGSGLPEHLSLLGPQ